MDLVLNNIQRLICHKNPTNQPTNQPNQTKDRKKIISRYKNTKKKHILDKKTIFSMNEMFFENDIHSDWRPVHKVTVYQFLV